ncbi:hypothetical protein ANO14919_146060 [Xylariales sp. No.14919]|nr:hypothetical protein ANO14919_146060 [Xylariales sp. No.14919]
MSTCSFSLPPPPPPTTTLPRRLSGLSLLPPPIHFANAFSYSAGQSASPSLERQYTKSSLELFTGTR